MPTKTDLLDPARVSVLRSVILLAAGALIGLTLAGYGLFTAKGTRTHGVPAEAVALVNQRPILRSDFMTQAQTEFTTSFAEITSDQRRKVLNDMINEELLMQRGLEIDLPSYDPDVRNALVAGVELEVTADVLAQQPTEDDLHAFYDTHQERYSSEGVLRLRDLVVKNGPARALQPAGASATEAVSALRRGEALPVVMERFSLVDSGRFVDSGHVDLGDIYQFAVHAKVDKVLEEAILPLKDGEVSEPVAEPDGMHVVVMVRHRFPVAQTFDEAQNRVWTDVKTEAQNRAKAANLRYLRGRADVLVAPDIER